MVQETPPNTSRKRGRPKAAIRLTRAAHEQLQAWSRQRMTAQSLALRARIVLACAAGESDVSVAAKLSTSPQTVAKWRKRFLQSGIEGLADAPRTGAPRKLDDPFIRRLMARTITERSPAGTHWTTRMMAREFSISQSAVSRLWRHHGLRPWRQETFRLSADPGFRDRIVDIIAIHLDPPLKAFALCVGQKTASADSGPQQKGKAQRNQAQKLLQETLRHGEGSILALGAQLGKRQVEASGSTRPLLGFFQMAAANTPQGYEIHVVIDDQRNRPRMLSWLVRRPWIRLHFTPHPAAWFNELLECQQFLAKKHARLGMPSMTLALLHALDGFLAGQGDQSGRLTWFKPARDIELGCALNNLS